MSTAGVVIEAWKLDAFKEVLTQAEYSYTGPRPLPDGMLMLKVEYDDVAELSRYIWLAQARCRASRLH